MGGNNFTRFRILAHAVLDEALDIFVARPIRTLKRATSDGDGTVACVPTSGVASLRDADIALVSTALHGQLGRAIGVGETTAALKDAQGKITGRDGAVLHRHAGRTTRGAIVLGHADAALHALNAYTLYNDARANAHLNAAGRPAASILSGEVGVRAIDLATGDRSGHTAVVVITGHHTLGQHISLTIVAVDGAVFDGKAALAHIKGRPVKLLHRQAGGHNPAGAGIRLRGNFEHAGTGTSSRRIAEAGQGSVGDGEHTATDLEVDTNVIAHAGDRVVTAHDGDVLVDGELLGHSDVRTQGDGIASRSACNRVF